MKVPFRAGLLAALALAATTSQATVINSTYTRTGASSWLASFTVVNDGTPATFAGFTIDLPNATNLVLVASPSTWDSIVAQPDAALSDPGFFDSFAISASNWLAIGQSLGGFKVSFDYLAGTQPGALPFLVYNAAFTPLFGGATTVTAAVPEPATAGVLAVAGAGLLARRRRRSA